MNDAAFVDVLGALANEHRLSVFRLLMPHGPNGLPAGDISRRLNVPASTLSSHLSQLCHAGLLQSRREQRQIYYAVNIEGTRRLIAFLTEDCCQGRPEICGYGDQLACS